MATNRPSGIIVALRGDAAAQPALKLRRRRLGQFPQAGMVAGARRRGLPAAPALGEEEAIVDALEKQELDFVDAVPLAAGAGPARRRRAGEAVAAAAGEADITVPLGPMESAVILVERDGVYEWNIGGVEGPAPAVPAAAAGRRRRTGAPPAAVPTAVRSARFTIAVNPLPAEAAPAAGGARRRAGLLRRLGVGKVVAYVFRFVSRPILGGAARFLERNVREGLVRITRPDPESWTALAEDAPLSLPAGRAARILLLVHGTFSSTVGSFGALAAQTQGRAFLEAALRHYDLVIGWDHRTLSVLPTDNAVDLAARLERLGFAEPPRVDAIAHSRGGLVLRSLIEYVLPSARLKLAMRRAVFVACTNGGTELARPQNWHRLAERYTNLAAAGARAAALMPGFASAGAILAASIRGVGVLVKALASAAVSDGAVPGLAAMDPGGDFVAEINGEQAGQPSPGQTYYCAITSNFDPDTARAHSDPAILPPGLLLKLADKAADALLGKPNDLVVHVESMTQIDASVGAYVRERHDYGTNGRVHHCNYFSQPATAQALATWLELTLAAAGTRRGRRASVLTGGPVVLPGSARPAAPARKVVTLPSNLSVAGALERVAASSAPWVVVERPYTEGGRPVTLRYAHPSDLARGWLEERRGKRDSTVFEAFDLHEGGRSPEAPAGSNVARVAVEQGDAQVLNYPHGSRYRTVLMDRGDPVGVLPPQQEDTGYRPPQWRWGLQPPKMAGAEPPEALPPAPPSPPAGGRRRGLRAKGAQPPAPSPAPPAARGGAETACHFRAETDDEYVLRQPHTVTVTIAREALEASAGKVSAGKTASVKVAKPLVVECMPMLRVALADPDYARAQIAVPAPGEPAELRFDLIGQEAGTAEVRVQVRQGPLPLVTLTLKPMVVAERSGTRRVERAAADIASFPEIPRATDELRIVQTRPTEFTTQYRYELRLPSKKLQAYFESAVLDCDPGSYVARIHKGIEDRWAEHGSEREAFARDLRAIGADFFDKLFPLELRQLLWKHREAIGTVQVLSSEPFIPWELVHLRDPATKKAGPDSVFLGEMGVVRWLVNGYPPEKLRLRKGKARYVIPDYTPPDALPDAQREKDLVKQRFGATAVAPEATPIYRLLESPGQFDLLHVACHGVADAADIDSARLEMPGRLRTDGSMSDEHVRAKTVERDADLDDGGARPIVVLNACQSGRGGYTLKGLGGFAQAFVEGGVGVFIGSSWSVGDVPAYAFIEEFYKRFLDRRKPEPLARAAAAARLKAKADGDATWLAYVVYGHPRATVSIE